MQKLTLGHLQCAYRILRYASGTKDKGLLYRNGIAETLVGYTDVDWAGDSSDRRSTSSYIFSLCSAGVAWSNKKQPTMALLSSEAEYCVTTVATCEAIWLRRLLQDL